MMPVTTNLLFIHVVCTKGLVSGAKIACRYYFGICIAFWPKGEMKKLTL